MSELGTLGKYELKSEIGRGSSGTVYLATDSFTREDVALKVLDKRLLDDPEHRRVVQGQFLNEASLVGKLAHPHIVSILDASVGDKTPTNFCFNLLSHLGDTALVFVLFEALLKSGEFTARLLATFGHKFLKHAVEIEIA